MQKIPYKLVISLVNDAVDDIRSGYDYDDFLANMSVQDTAKNNKVSKDTLKRVWEIANKTVRYYDEILDETSDTIEEDEYGHARTCAIFLCVKCSET